MSAQSSRTAEWSTAHRPPRTLVVTGTGTEVGKTWVSAHLLEEFARAEVSCVARKPAQSFDPGDSAPRDADVLAEATGENPDVVCPPHRNYGVAMAPPMAADVLGDSPILLNDMVAELEQSWPEQVPRLALVELAGGVRSPIADDGDCARFISVFEPSDVLLVADAGLGTINAVMSALDSLAATRAVGPDAGSAVTVYLNRYDTTSELHRRNRTWLESAGCGSISVTPSELARVLAVHE